MVSLSTLLYVDSILIAFREKDEIKRLKSLIGSESEMKDMDTIVKILRWLSRGLIPKEVLYVSKAVDSRGAQTL